MYKLGTFIKMTHSGCAYEDQIRFVKTLTGLKSVEIWMEKLDLQSKEIIDARKLLGEIDVLVHAPFTNVSLISCHEEINNESIKIYKNLLKIAKKISAKSITLHAGSYPNFFTIDEVREVAIKNIKILLQESSIFTLENISVGKKVNISYPTELSELVFLKKKIPELTFTIDIGHAIKNGNSKDEIENFFMRYKNSILDIHLHDAVNGGRDHTALGTGSLDIDWFFDVLRRCNYKNYINLEMLNNKDVEDSWKLLARYINP